jgi:hypothetical protein
MEFLDDVVNETAVEVLTTQVSVTGGCLTSNIPLPNSQQKHQKLRHQDRR